MKIAHVVRYYPEVPYTNGLEVAIAQFHNSLKALGYTSEIIAINTPHLLKRLEKFDKIVLHFRRSSTLKVINWCKKEKKPAYLICHNGIGSIYYNSPNLLKIFFALFSGSHYVYKKVSGVIVLNSDDYNCFNAWFPKVKSLQSFWGIDQERFKFIDPTPFYEKLNLRGDELLILSPARIHLGKNLILLLKIWDEIVALYPNVHLVFMGDVGEKDRKYYKVLKEQVDKLTNKEKIHWVNDVSYSDEMLVHAYSAASIVISPSFKESFGLVVLEASAVGKPLIVSPVGVVPSFIKEGFNGFIRDPKDPNAWKEILLKLLGNKQLRQEIGNNAKQEVLEKYSWKGSTLKILEFMRDH